MPPALIDIRNTDDIRDVVHQSVQTLVEGNLVVFPTETLYGVAASALSASAVDKLCQLKSRKEGQPLALAVKSADEAWDYVPHAGALGRRLARRCWPGPVTLVMDNQHPDSLLHRLPENVLQAVSPQGTLGLRVPAHRLIMDVLDLLTGPLVLTSANRTTQSESMTAAAVIESLGDDVQLVLDDGRCHYSQSSSVVRVDNNELRMLREGVVSCSTMDRLSSFIAVIVCTGNTCRSPMAEVLLKKRFAEKIGCPFDELEDRGILVLSAGIAAGQGMPASSEAVEVMKNRGLELMDHGSQRVTDRLVRDADVIFTMTRAHQAALIHHWPTAKDRCFTLSLDGLDVSDPIGGPMQLYERCAEQIDTYLAERIEQLDAQDYRPPNCLPPDPPQ